MTFQDNNLDLTDLRLLIFFLVSASSPVWGVLFSLVVAKTEVSFVCPLVCVSMCDSVRPQICQKLKVTGEFSSLSAPEIMLMIMHCVLRLF